MADAIAELCREATDVFRLVALPAPPLPARVPAPVASVIRMALAPEPYGVVVSSASESA